MSETTPGRRFWRGLAPTLALALLAPLGLATGAQAAPACDGLTATIVGTNRVDTITGTPGDDVIAAGNGDDVVDGAGGDDTICGENGNDLLTGGAGDDVLLGGNGDDELRGGDGADRLLGENGADTVLGERGDDALVGANGTDLLDAGRGTDSADGGHGKDRCVDAETAVSCEEQETTEPENPLEAMGAAKPGSIPVDGPDGVRLVVESGGGLYPWDVTIARDALRTKQVADALVSPVYEFDLPADAVVESARLTIPYRTDLLDGFPEADLRLYHFDDDLGLWVGVPGEQVVDTDAKTVSATVDSFSAYAVFKLDERGFERYWPTKEVFCLQQGDASDVGVDVAFVVDTSGSMSGNDPAGIRADGALAFLDEMRPTDRAAVVRFASSASTLIGLTALDTTTNVDAVRAAIERTRGASGGTSLNAAVQAGLAALDVEDTLGRARVMILLTDGQSSYSPWWTEAAREDGVVVHTIGLGSGVQASVLEAIAAGTGGTYLHLSDASQLPDLYAQLGKGVIDDGTDTDTDGLTDCQETYGVLTSYGFYDTSLDYEENDPFLGNRRVTSDPTRPDTDGDGLTDGVEVRGLDLDDPIDMRDYPALVETYGFLVDAGVTSYYIGHSLPDEVDSDRDTVDDRTETVGVTTPSGAHHDSRADRVDTDFDQIDDDVEYRIGTDPRAPDANDVGIDGLAPFTLFQHEKYGTSEPVIQARYGMYRGVLTSIEYQDTIRYDSDWNCVENCSALIAASADMPHSWCWVPFLGTNCSTEEKVRNLVQQGVNAQEVFTKDGDFRGTFAVEQGVVECALTNLDPTACGDAAAYADTPSSIPLDDPDMSDGPSGDNLLTEIAAVVLAVPGGYNPKNLCSPGLGGVYELVDLATNQVMYVGETNDFERRRLEHARDTRLGHLSFRQVFSAENRQVRRGLEQYLYNRQWGDVDIRSAQAQGSLNGQRPMSVRNPLLRPRARLVESFLAKCR